MYQAERINDPTRYPWSLKLTRDGFRGKRFYRVRCPKIEDAFEATGMPIIGEPWSATRPDVWCVGIDPRDERAGGEWKIVEVEYETNNGQIPYVDTTTTTRLVHANTTRNVTHDINCKKIDSDGRGETKILSTLFYEVTQYFTNLPDLIVYHTLCDEPKVNANPQVMGNLFGSGESVTVPAGQLLFAGFRVERQDRLFVITSTLHWRRDWHAYRAIEGPSGLCDDPGNLNTFDIYETADFGGVIG